MSISNKFKSITVSDERPVYEKFNITEEQYNIVKEIYDIYSESYDLHIDFINKLNLLRDNRWRISKGMNYLENNYLDDIYKKRENKLSVEEVLELINVKDVKDWWI